MPGARKRFLPGCPAKYLTEDLQTWFEGYTWLTRFNKTPMDLGLVTLDELDPRWFAMMNAIDREMLKRPPKNPERQP